jgi:RimJ/RimL family protein N-acetyltransferase
MVHDLVEFTPAAYAELAGVRSACRPELPLPAAALRAKDEARPARKLLRRTVAREDGAAVGYCELGQEPLEDDDGVFVLGVFVHPSHQGRGLGRALHTELLRLLAGLDARELRAGLREDHPYAAAFAARRGFESGRRHVFSQLELGAQDPPEAPAGVRLTSLAELRAELGENETVTRLFPLVQDFTADIPGAAEAARDMRAEQLARNLADPLIIPEVYCIAASGDELVGKSDLRATPDPRGLWTGTTGVHRAWRRRGLALALKRTALGWAAARGFERVATANAEENHAMLALNRRLGFEPTCTYRELRALR